MTVLRATAPSSTTTPVKTLPSKRIIDKVIAVGLTTLASRLLGLAREILLNKFLGGGLSADLFFTAYKIPNSLRKIFAEGALSASLVPTCVQVNAHDGKEEVSRLITLSLLIFQAVLVSVCVLIFWQAEYVVRFIAPGWFISPGSSYYSSSVPFIGTFLEWVAPAWYVTTPLSPTIEPIILYLRVLIGFIVCLSSSALFAAALQVSHHFFIPALSPVLLNIVYIIGLFFGLWYGCSTVLLCYLILAGGIAQAVLHIGAYWWFDFSFSRPTKATWDSFRKVLAKFIPCFLSMSILEINLFVSTSQATYLQPGSIASIYYANRFMGIPLGVFAVALSTILLPYLSKVSLYAPKRLGFYLLEAAKLIAWITVPLTFLLIFFSENIFITLFLSSKFTLVYARMAALFLRSFALGLFFFSLNKILLNIFYALHETKLITLFSLIIALVNYSVGRTLTPYYAGQGLVYAFVIASVVQTVLLASTLVYKYNLKLYLPTFITFLGKLGMQMGIGIALFYGAYRSILGIFSYFLPLPLATLLSSTYLLWFWVGPLVALLFMSLWMTQEFFGIKLVLVR